MRALLAVALASIAAVAHAAPALQLPDDARPKRYVVDLKIDPHADSVVGIIDVELDVGRATSTLWLDAQDLSITSARLQSGTRSLTARVLTGDRHALGFAFDEPVPVGDARLHIEYRAPLSETEVAGMSRQKVGTDSYVFTQFAAIDARRAFPCFDEPGYKVPWKLALTVRAGDRAFANMPQVSERVVTNGWKRVEFAETPPISSYLVAFSVGPFDIVDAGKSSTSGTPMRVLVPRGQRERAPYSATIAHLALEQLEDYFGTQCPFPKMDLVAMPHTSYGAMENPGLITFAEQLLLADPKEDAERFRHDCTETIVHELSHQWFGNLVTMKWWDDVWLNEAFATWITQKLIAQHWWNMRADVGRVSERNVALDADSLSSVTPVHRAVRSYDDILGVYDAINYQKGARVIDMFERLVGVVSFRRGVRQYLADHARGTADEREFIAAISKAAGRDVAPAFASFLDQPGYPVVSVALDCQSKPPTLKLAQHRYRPLGSAPMSDETWEIPMCARWPGGHTCTLFDNDHGELPLAGAISCPAWVFANDRGTGYYRVSPNAAVFTALVDKALPSLTDGERLALWSDALALADSGELELASVVRLAEKLAGGTQGSVEWQVLGFVAALDDRGLVDESARPAYRDFLERLFGKRARSLGLVAKEHDDDRTRALRAVLVPGFARAKQDRALVLEARALMQKWLRNESVLTPDLATGVLAAAVREGDAALWESIVGPLRATKGWATRPALLWALGQFRDPRLIEKSLALVVDDPDPSHATDVYWSALGDVRTRAAAWAWLQAHYDALVARLSRDAITRLASSVERFCDDASIEAARAFFTPRLKDIDGGLRALDVASERAHLCVAGRAGQAQSLAAFLRSEGPHAR